MYEDFSLRQVLDIEVSQERVENLKKLTHLDLSEGTPEAVKDFMLRQWAQQVNITYARFMAGIKFTPADVDELMQGAIDIHAHGGSDPFDRLLPEDEVCKDYKVKKASRAFKVCRAKQDHKVHRVFKVLKEKTEAPITLGLSMPTHLQAECQTIQQVKHTLV